MLYNANCVRTESSLSKKNKKKAKEREEGTTQRKRKSTSGEARENLCEERRVAFGVSMVEVADGLIQT